MSKQNSRRSFLKTTGTGLLLAPAVSFIGCGTARQAATKEIESPIAGRSSKLQLNVKDFGATGDGQTKDTLAIQQTIDRCSVLGGGEVLLPAGNYLTGALALRSDVLLRLEKDTVISGSPDFADYPVSQVRWEGKWIKGHVGLIYAFDVKNSGIVGPGKINGSHNLGGRPNEKYPLRHPALIEPVGCHNLRFEDFSTDY